VKIAHHVAPFPIFSSIDFYLNFYLKESSNREYLTKYHFTRVLETRLAAVDPL